MSKGRGILGSIMAWLYDKPDVDINPFEYLEVATEDLEVGDYLVAHDAYIQMLGYVEFDGSRRLLLKKGHQPAFEVVAYEGDIFSVRQLRKE